MEKQKRTLKEWWSQARPTKAVAFWSWIASIVLTIVVGFAWGGWVTGANAGKMAETVTEAAVTERLGAICAHQFSQDPAQDQKLEELKKTNKFDRRGYVQDQGWATMPGEEEPDGKVADECVRLLMLINP